jgi:DNA-binding NtrC family response regulator
VRALRHACERAVILGCGDEYGVDDFGVSGTGLSPAAGSAGMAVFPTSALAAGSDGATLNALERDAIAAALATTKGNISHTARMLGVSRAALYRKLGKHGI